MFADMTASSFFNFSFLPKYGQAVIQGVEYTLILSVVSVLMAVLPAFLLAMYERDGLPFEKVLGNIIRAKFLRPGVRPYQTQNIYAPFTGKEEPIAENKKAQAQPRKK